MREEVGGHTAAVYMVQLAEFVAFLCSPYLAFSPCVSLASMWCLTYWYNCLSFRQWSRRPGFNSRSSYTKDSKWYLMPPCLTPSVIRYGSRVSGAMQGKE